MRVTIMRTNIIHPPKSLRAKRSNPLEIASRSARNDAPADRCGSHPTLLRLAGFAGLFALFVSRAALAQWCPSMATTYDALGRVTSTSDGLNQTTYSYDSLGRKTQMIDPDLGKWTYAY